MRWLVRAAILAAILWSLYWGALALAQRQVMSGWLEDRRDQGWQVEHDGLRVGGFPFRNELQATGLALMRSGDDASGAASWNANWIRLESQTLEPGRQALRFSPAEQRLALGDSDIAWIAEDARAFLHARIGPRLEFEAAGLRSGPWRLTSSTGRPYRSLRADSLEISATRDAEAPEIYRIRLEIPEFAAFADSRPLDDLADAPPDGSNTVVVRATAEFDQAWTFADTGSGAERPLPRRFEIDQADFRVGELEIAFGGSLEVGEDGRLSGSLSAKATGWTWALDTLFDVGLVSENTREFLAGTLALAADLSGEPDSVDLDLDIDRGQISWSGFPLGSIPPLSMR